MSFLPLRRFRSAAEPRRTATAQDLGTLGGEESHVTAIDGDIVVGSAITATGRSHAFAYDLGAAAPTMIDLGTLGGAWSEATDVSGDIVVDVCRDFDLQDSEALHDAESPAAMPQEPRSPVAPSPAPVSPGRVLDLRGTADQADGQAAQKDNAEQPREDVSGARIRFAGLRIRRARQGVDRSGHKRQIPTPAGMGD